MTEFFASGSFRRAIVSIFTGAAIVLHKKLGIEMDQTDIGALAGVVIAYLVQSSSKEKKLAEIDAAGATAAAAVANPVAAFTPEAKP